MLKAGSDGGEGRRDGLIWGQQCWSRKGEQCLSDAAKGRFSGGMWRHCGKLRGVAAPPKVTQGTSMQGPLGFRSPTVEGAHAAISKRTEGPSWASVLGGMTSHLL